VDCPTERENGAENGKKIETDAVGGVQSKSRVAHGLATRQDAGQTSGAISSASQPDYEVETTAQRASGGINFVEPLWLSPG